MKKSVSQPQLIGSKNEYAFDSSCQLFNNDMNGDNNCKFILVYTVCITYDLTFGNIVVHSQYSSISPSKHSFNNDSPAKPGEEDLKKLYPKNPIMMSVLLNGNKPYVSV